MPYGGTAHELYRPLAFVYTMLAANSLIALSSRQIAMYIVPYSIAWLAAFVTIFRPILEADRKTTLVILVVGIIGLVWESLSLFLMRSLSLKLLADAEEQANTTRSMLDRLTRVLSDARDGMNIGDRIIDATECVKHAVGTVATLQEYLEEESRKLLDEAETLKESGSKIMSSTKRMEEGIMSQTAAITETSASLEQITRNISSINTVADKRRLMLGEASGAALAQKELIRKLDEAFQAVRSSSEGIKAFVTTVQDIASRTALLSMNASIEAARAGSSGKGFAVVAQEIRTLSGETQRQSDVIKQMIDRNDTTVRETGSLIESFGTFVGKNIENTQILLDSMDEIMKGLSEMNAGTTEVMVAITDIVSGTRLSGEMVKEVVSQIDGQQSGFEHLSDFTKELDGKILDIRSTVSEIRSAADLVSEAGRLNIEQTKKLQADM
jgi:methyl-accepting chemotaxis protein